MLANARIPFRKKVQRFGRSHNRLPQFSCGFRIFSGDLPDDPLQIVQKGILEIYFVVHSRIRNRTSLPVALRLPGVSAWRTALSKAANNSGLFSSHSLNAGAKPSFSTNAARELIANRRSSSVLKQLSSASIWSMLT